MTSPKLPRTSNARQRAATGNTPSSSWPRARSRLGGGVTLKEAASAGHVERLGGVGEIVAGQLRELTGKETRAVVLGHLLRGGQPTSLDRSLGLVFGAAAVRALVEGHDGVMVAVNPPRIDYVPLKVATAKLKLVAADDYGVMTARTLDISFGDAPVSSISTDVMGRRET